MVRQRTGGVLIASGVALLLLSAVVQSATLRIRAVALNGNRITPTSSLAVEPGDLIEVDFAVSGWGTAISTVGIYQITIDTNAMIDQSGPDAYGSIKPRDYDTPTIYPSDFYINIEVLRRGVCSAESADADASCVSSPAPCSDATCVFGVCDGGINEGQVCATPDNQCDGGACVSNPDFLFRDHPGPICAVAAFPHYRAGCFLISDDGPADESQCVGGSADGAPCDGDSDCPGGACDVVEYYVGTVVLEVGNDAGGVFRLDVQRSGWSFFADPGRVNAPLTTVPLVLDAGPLGEPGGCCVQPGDCRYVGEGECLALGGVFLGGFTDCFIDPDFCACPLIVDATPANCAIDARYPHPPGGSPDADRIGFESVEVTLSDEADMGLLSPADFSISFVGGAGGDPPVVTAVTPLDGTTLRVDFDSPFPFQRWTCLSMACAPPGTQDVCWGHLPGDVGGDATASAADVLDLVDFLDGVGPQPLEWYQCDVDDSGACNAADVLGVIDLLNGAGPFDPWNNVTTSGGSCPTTEP